MFFTINAFFLFFFFLYIPEAHTSDNIKGLQPLKVHNSMGLIKHKVSVDQVFILLTSAIGLMLLV